MLASVPGSQKHPSSREMYGRLRGSGSLRGAFLGSDVIFAQQGVSVSFQSRYGAIIGQLHERHKDARMHKLNVTSHPESRSAPAMSTVVST